MRTQTLKGYVVRFEFDRENLGGEELTKRAGDAYAACCRAALQAEFPGAVVSAQHCDVPRSRVFTPDGREGDRAALEEEVRRVTEAVRAAGEWRQEPTGEADADPDLSVCSGCGHKCLWNGVPVTMPGWYGDVYYTWGQYAGVHMQRGVSFRCPKCRTQWSAELEWDR